MAALRRQIRVARILWLAILVGTGVMAGIGLGVPFPERVIDPVLGWVLGGVALGAAVASFAVPGMFLKKTLAGIEPDARSSELRVASAYLTFAILGLALRESIAVTGLVVLVLGAPAQIGLAFFGLSWLLLLPSWPSEDRARDLLRSAAPRGFSFE